MKRVVITGMSALTSLGHHWYQVRSHIEKGQSGVRLMEDWQAVKGLNSYLAAPVELDARTYPRKKVRGMSRVSLLATRATEQSIEASGIKASHKDYLNMGIAYGSSIGATEPFIPFARVIQENIAKGISPTSYIQVMSHTAAVNLSIFFGLKGRMIPTSAACASGGQALGYAYETIKQGIHPWMVAGSAEAVCSSQAVVFDSFYAASLNNEHPAQAVKPFDQFRDGMVVGEGAATFVLEDMEHALARGAPVLAEIVGFATNMDGFHIVKPDTQSMAAVMEHSLASAACTAKDIDYINAHASGVATDANEAEAIRQVFGNKTPPVSSSKGHIGHTMGACGALEAWLAINMMNDGILAPTLNLTSVADECGGINHILSQPLKRQTDYVMSNNFAFGGVNTSLIFRRWLNKR